MYDILCRNTKYVEINLITKIRIPQWPSTKRVIGAASTGALDKSQSFYALQHSFPEKPIFWFCKFKQQPLKLYPNSHMYPCYHNSNRLLLLSQSLQVSQGLLLQVSFIGLKWLVSPLFWPSSQFHGHFHSKARFTLVVDIRISVLIIYISHPG